MNNIKISKIFIPYRNSLFDFKVIYQINKKLFELKFSLMTLKKKLFNGT